MGKPVDIPAPSVLIRIKGIFPRILRNDREIAVGDAPMSSRVTSGSRAARRKRLEKPYRIGVRTADRHRRAEGKTLKAGE